MSQGIATTERVGHAGHVVFVSRGVTFTPGDLESGTLAILMDRYGDPKEGAPELLAAARAEGWRATLMTGGRGLSSRGTGPLLSANSCPRPVTA
jgi:hypothetical protein